MIKKIKSLSLIPWQIKKYHQKKVFPVYYWRHRLINLLMVLLIVLIISRIFYLQVVNKHFLQYQGEQRSVRFMSKPAYRGIIFDRNGTALAVSTCLLVTFFKFFCSQFYFLLNISTFTERTVG